MNWDKLWYHEPICYEMTHLGIIKRQLACHKLTLTTNLTCHDNVDFFFVVKLKKLMCQILKRRQMKEIFVWRTIQLFLWTYTFLWRWTVVTSRKSVHTFCNTILWIVGHVCIPKQVHVFYSCFLAICGQSCSAF